MKTKTINLYSFDELSEEAKQTAINELRLNFNPWEKENREAITALINLFPVSVNWRNNTVQVGGELSELSGLRLAKFIWNNYRKDLYKPKQYWICNGTHNCVGIGAKHRDSKLFLVEDGCPLTGFWMDNEVLKPIFDFLRRPDNSTFEDLMEQCISAYETACDKDFDFQTSDEQTIETIKANDYTFTEDGKLENE